MRSKREGDDTHEVTELLLAWRDGDSSAEERLLARVYVELSRIATNLMRGERPDHTLEPPALVHEAYLRLIDQRRTGWHNRAQFYSIAARVMRRVLLDHAKRRGRAKRGGGSVTLVLRLDGLPGAGADPRLEDLDHALRRLERENARVASVVEMRCFGGLSVAETAAALDASERTVARDWRFAKAWLVRELMSDGETAGA